MSRSLRILLAAVGAGLVFAAPAHAHGLVGRSDLPIPEWLFLWAAAAVLVVSFAALALLWTSVQLEDVQLRRVLRAPRWLEAICGVLGVVAFAGVVYAGLAGDQSPVNNAAPTVVYVLFWVGVPMLSALFGDVFRVFSPWRAIGRATGWAVSRVMDEAPPPLRYPARAGRWPAAIGLLAFGWIELIAANGDKPSVLAVLAVAYLATQLVGMAIFGVDAWVDRADPFGVYFSMFARLSPLTRDDGFVALRRPLSGLTQLERLPGTVSVLCVAIGVTAFDGAAEGRLWSSIAPSLQDVFADLGLSLGTAQQVAFTIGMLSTVLIVSGF
jgi:hypothetical protein